jgi:hypothetical protein
LVNEASPDRRLARRLRELRERHWPDRLLSQSELALAFSRDGKKLGKSQISGWESPKGPAVPSESRLRDYATFFATHRSVEGAAPRLFGEADLTDDERAARDALFDELKALRSGSRAAATGRPGRQRLAGPNDEIGGGRWHFPDERSVTIVVAELPETMRNKYANPDLPDYVHAYEYADLDALIELYGHVRAVNPTIQVHIRTGATLRPDDYTTHLVVLGGVDWNPAFRELAGRLQLPVRQLRRDTDNDNGGFEVDGERFLPVVDRESDPATLTEDVALFFRGLNPFNDLRTVTVCSGNFGRGTYGAVRALTDARFRDRNERLLDERFGDCPSYGLLFPVSIPLRGEGITPDWSKSSNRLYEWSEPAHD